VIVLKPHQEEAVRRALKHDGFLLAMEMRTGKTFTACTVAARRDCHRVLIACPSIAKKVWVKAIEDLGLDEKIDWLILSLDELHNRRKQLRQWLRDIEPSMMIVDESQRIKNRKSTRSKAVRFIATGATYRLALTGTPIAQGIWDAWSQFDFLMPGLFGSWQEFEDAYLIVERPPGKRVSIWAKKIVGTKNVQEFNAKFHEHMYRVELEEVKAVATKIRRVKVKVQLPSDARKTYREFAKTMETMIAGKRVYSQQVITKIIKLQQIAGGWLLDNEVDRQPHFLHAAKRLKVFELVKKLDEPTVIFVRFIHELEDLRLMFAANGLTVTPTTDVAIVQIQSGVAIDLSRARAAIFYSMNYSYLDYDQAQFRIRTMDTEAVTYYYLLTEKTVDEDIYEAVTLKKNVAAYICDKYRKDRRHASSQESIIA
jgi:hypothetical protein